MMPLKHKSPERQLHKKSQNLTRFSYCASSQSEFVSHRLISVLLDPYRDGGQEQTLSFGESFYVSFFQSPELVGFALIH